MSDNNDLLAQQDEVLALQSIYNGDEVKIKDTNKGILIAHTKHPFNVVNIVVDIETVPNRLKHLCIYDSDGKLIYQVKHFPPLLLNFEYPINYPSQSCAIYSLACLWLSGSQLDILRGRMLKEWEESRDVVLFNWMSLLVDECWDILGFSRQFELGELSPNIISEICSFDYERRVFVFQQSVYSCNVCFDEFKGMLCLQFLPCEHVFCKLCMKSYFEVLIKSGEVNKLTCPTTECPSIALPTQVKKIVDKDLYDKYDQFLLQRTLDQMPDVFLCPRPFCKVAVLKEPDSNMAECSGCKFIFCVLCEKTWHGYHTRCELTKGRFVDIYKEWEAADDGHRSALYKKYGKAKLMKIISEYQSADWLNKNSKACPSCCTPIELTTGCNKVQCACCLNYMCWLCGSSINRSDPYSHFRPGGPCEDRLFENTVISENGDEFGDFDDDDIDDWILFIDSDEDVDM